MASNEKLLHDSWHQHPTAKPFAKTFQVSLKIIN